MSATYSSELDEPFSNLDSGLRRRVRDDVLRVIKPESDTAALMVTHDPESVPNPAS